MKIISAEITGSLIINGSDVTLTVESSSIWSGSIASRVDSLEQFSSSLDANFATDEQLNQATASLSESISILSGSYLTTSASYSAASESISDRVNIVEDNYVTTGSNTFIGNQTITGSLNTTGSFELYGDQTTYGNIIAVQKTIAVLGFPTEQPAIYSEGNVIISGSLNLYVEELSQSFDIAESFQSAFSAIDFSQNQIDIISSSYATTGSNTFIGNQTITGSILNSGSLTINGNLTSTGQIIAQTINVQQVTSSIVYSCGDNVFGTALTNTQTLCGNVFNTGSLACFAGRICSNTLSVSSTTNLGGALTGTSATFGGNLSLQGAVTRNINFYDDTCTNINAQIQYDQIAANSGQFFFKTNNAGTLGTKLTIANTGVATFACQVCAPNATISNCLGVGIASPQGNFEVIGLSYFTRSSNSLLINPNYGGANTHVQLQVVCNMGLAFATNGDCERMRISSGGITCFSNTVCAPFFSAGDGTQCNADDAPLTIKRNVGFAGLDFKSLRTTGNIGGTRFHDCAGVVQAQQLVEVDGSFNFYNETNNNRFKITSAGIACFACTVCLPTSNTSLVAGTYGTISNVGGIDTNIGNNAYYDGTNWRRFAAQEAARIYINRDSFSFLRKASDGAGSCISWDNTLFLASSGIACFACQVCTPTLSVNAGVFAYGSAGGLGCIRIITATGTNEQNAIILDKAGGFGESFIKSYYTNVPNYGIAFGAGSGVTAMYIQCQGFVGIGTSTPAARLHVQSPNNVIGRIIIKGGKDDVTNVGEINSQLDFGSNDSSVSNDDNIGGRIASVTEFSNGAFTGMAFYTYQQGRSPDLKEAVRITNNGDVGIGTASPFTSSGYRVLDLFETTNGGHFVVRSANVTAEYQADEGSGGAYFGTRTNHFLSIRTNTLERMRITSGGNVGIGTASPNGKLTTFGNEIGCQITFTKDAPSGVYGRLGQDNNGTFLTQNAIWNGSTWSRDNTGLASMALALHNGNSRYEFRIAAAAANPITWTTALAIETTGAATFSSSVTSNSFMKSNAAFTSYTEDGLFSANATYSAVITPGGSERIRFGYFDYGGGQYYGRIGFQANTNWSLGTIGSAGNDFSIGVGASGQVLTITSTSISCFSGTVCAPCFATISDYRMKSNLQPIDGLSIIMNTKPYKFNYNYDCSTSFGMIAHELQDVLPEAVFGHKDGEVMQGVDYMKLLPIAIKAIQELKCENNLQQQQIERLRSQVGG